MDYSALLLQKEPYLLQILRLLLHKVGTLLHYLDNTGTHTQQKSPIPKNWTSST
jgi:hypothetical protein